MKPYEDNHIRIFNKDSRDMSELPDESVDLLLTDPPYGISFMGKDWDKALPDRRIWDECLRVLKFGAFAFVMSIPRADCLSRMIISLEGAGFCVNFTPIFWAYAAGFPKAQNIGKAVDKKLGAEREVVGIKPGHEAFANRGNLSSVQSLKGTLGGKGGFARPWMEDPEKVERYHSLTAPNTPQAKALDGSYGGFQPKPAVEVIIVAMKPLSEKTFVDQALENEKGITWLDDGRIPIDKEVDKTQIRTMNRGVRPPDDGWGLNESKPDKPQVVCPQGRFPANLLVSDDALDTGEVTKSGKDAIRQQEGMFLEHKLEGKGSLQVYHPDSGSFSRYFDLDKWWEERIKLLPEPVRRTFPFLIVPKASKSEKNRGIGVAVSRTKHGSTPRKNEAENKSPNYHPTVKPVKLMSYLITLGSREGDTVLDNFGGSGTTAVAARLLGRKCVMYEIDERYCEIAVHRLRQMVLGLTS